MDSPRNSLISNANVWIHKGIHGFPMIMHGFLKELIDFLRKCMDPLKTSLISNENVWIPEGIHRLLMKMYGFLKEFIDL